MALRLKHDATWHTYWINPGTGYPTSLRWTLPEGFSAGEIQWPTPHVVKDTKGIVTGHGYRTQQWPVARFALAEGEEPKRFEVRHPGGRARTLTVPPEGAVSVLKP